MRYWTFGLRDFARDRRGNVERSQGNRRLVFYLGARGGIGHRRISDLRRQWREDKVLAALTTDGMPLDELVPRAYDDVQAFVLPIAERIGGAKLEKVAFAWM